MTSGVVPNHSIEIRRSIAAPRPRLFQIWTQPGELRDCMGLKDASVDLRIGGSWIWGWGQEPIFGVFREIDPPAYLEFTFSGNDREGCPTGSTLVTLELLTVSDRITEVVLSHSQFPLAEQAEEFAQGWRDCLLALSAYAEAETELQLADAGELPATRAAPAPGKESPAGTDEAAMHKRLAARFFNETWALLEKPNPSREEQDRMIHSAHASRLHWGFVGDAANLSIGEWQVARVYSILRRTEPALYHAKRCLQIALENNLQGFTRACAFEAMARALNLTGDPSAAEYVQRARELAEGLTHPEEKRLLEADLASARASPSDGPIELS